MNKPLHQINVDTQVLMAIIVGLDFALDDPRGALNANWAKIIKTCLERFYEMALKVEPEMPRPNNLKKNLFITGGLIGKDKPS